MNLFPRKKNDFETLCRHFDRANVRYQKDATRQSVSAVFRGDHSDYSVVSRIRRENVLQVFVTLPTVVPQGCLPDIRRAIALANQMLLVGAFEESHERVYFYGYGLYTEQVCEALIRRVVSTCLAVADHFTPAFQSVIYANEPAVEAVRRVWEDVVGRPSAYVLRRAPNEEDA